MIHLSHLYNIYMFLLLMVSSLSRDPKSRKHLSKLFCMSRTGASHDFLLPPSKTNIEIQTTCPFRSWCFVAFCWSNDMSALLSEQLVGGRQLLQFQGVDTLRHQKDGPHWKNHLNLPGRHARSFLQGEAS